MKNFLKELLISTLADLASKLIFKLCVSACVLSGIGGVFMNSLSIYFFAFSFFILLILVICEVYKTKTVGVGILIKDKASQENGGLWDNRHSLWLEIENNNQNVDFKDCFVYLKKLDDNGVDLLPKTTKTTNNFEWENYSKGQEKVVKSGNGRERVNVAFANGGFNKKYFLFEGGKKENIPAEERVGIEIVVSGKMKGIRINFLVQGYLVHEMFDYEKTITSKFYLEKRSAI
jgi:hypothetical protein